MSPAQLVAKVSEDDGFTRIEKCIETPYSGKCLLRFYKQIDLKVPEGEFISIMGPSGSGKTTMLNLVATLDKPTSGSVILKGEQPLELSMQKLAEFRRRQLGFVFQNYNLLSPLSVLENVILPLTLIGWQFLR